MTDRPVILPPDHLLSDEDILTDLYRQYASYAYLDKVYEGLLQMAELTGSSAGKGVSWEAVWTLRRHKASTYRMITVLEVGAKGGAQDSAPELDLEQYKAKTQGVSTTQYPKVAQRPSQDDTDPSLGFGFDGFDGL